jgi:nucleoside-diphosphate-sugar epimerase
MKVLVTGGAGFIGSHLAQALCARGADVIVLDNLSTGRLSNLDWKTPSQSLNFVQGDVDNTSLLNQIVQGVDWIFHEAALASVPQTIQEPIESNRVNLGATLNLLLAAKMAGVKRFVFASSAAVYGNDPHLPKTESMAPEPCSPYALQKWAGERYASLFYVLYGLPTVCLRYFNVFGPRQAFDSPYSGVIARFCTAMLRRQAPVILGDGRQTRDFVFIDNIVNANLQAAEAPASQVAGKVFNIAGGGPVSLLELVDEINRQTGQVLRPVFRESRLGDVRHSHADITLAQQSLGYHVLVPWTRGLALTLDFYRTERGP